MDKQKVSLLLLIVQSNPISPSEQEIDQGIMLVKTAKAVVSIFSCGRESNPLPKFRVESNFGGSFRLKAEVTEFARNSGVPFVNVEAVSMRTISRWVSSLSNSRRVLRSHRAFNRDAPVLSSTRCTICLFVRKPLSRQHLPGTEIFTYGELISFNDAISQLAESMWTVFRFSVLDLTDTRHSHWEENQLRSNHF